MLAALRQLRDVGLLEFRRGRGARVTDLGVGRAALDAASRELVRIARQHGYRRDELIMMIEALA
ncbi:hypothetical protein [uncultured Friedmanniella sp.]|uniref:hypothetical protein n=1 Tax=uncultured Friedmanniella sp. TaxID=335381 RepID=UPI0035CAAB6C